MESQDLQELIERGMVNQEKLLEILEMTRRQEILENHPYSIWYSEKANRWYTFLPDQTKPKNKRMVKRKDKKDVEQIVYDYYRTKADRPTVNDMFYLWLNEKKENITPQTAMKYESVYKRFIERTGFGRTEIKYLTFYQIDRFVLKTIGKDTMKAHTWADIRTDLIGVIRYARKMGYTQLSVNCLKDIDIPKNAFKKVQILPGEDVLTHEEVEKINNYINEHDDDIVLLGIRLVFKTGLRVGELAALKFSDFDFKKSVLTVTRTEIKTENPEKKKPKTITTVRDFTKGAKGWRQIIIDEETHELVDKIHALNPDGEFLFEVDGKRVNANAWTKKLPRLCAKLDIGTRVEGANYVRKKSMHKGRKNYASTLLHSGIEPKFVQAQLGHTDLHTTLSYYDRDVEEFEERKAALLPVLEKM